MKAKLLIVTTLCLWFFATTGQTQLFDLQYKIDSVSIGHFSLTDSDRVWMPAMLKDRMRLFWSGEGETLLTGSLLEDPDIRSVWGISDEQLQQMKDMGMEYIQKNIELQMVIGKIENDDGTYEVVVERGGMDEEQSAEVLTYIFDNALTPEQKQKKSEMLTAFMPETPIISLSIFEALDLTEDQKQQMEEIKKELDSEFESVLDEFAGNHMFLLEKVFGELEKQGEGRAMTERRQQSFVEKLLAEDPEYKAVHDENQFKTKAFSMRYKTRVFDVLTDEQWTRLQELIGNPPELTRVLLKKLKEQRGESETTKPWQPGPGSWQPGDPIPEQYRQERMEKRFPVRKVN